MGSSAKIRHRRQRRSREQLLRQLDRQLLALPKPAPPEPPRGRVMKQLQRRAVLDIQEVEDREFLVLMGKGL